MVVGSTKHETGPPINVWELQQCVRRRYIDPLRMPYETQRKSNNKGRMYRCSVQYLCLRIPARSGELP